MDFIFLAGAIALWVAMVLMVFGFKQLEKPPGGRL